MKKRIFSIIIAVFLVTIYSIQLAACDKPTVPQEVHDLLELDDPQYEENVITQGFAVDLDVKEDASAFHMCDLFGDNMLLQRHAVNKIYGTYTGEEEEIAVNIAGQNFYASIADGAFCVYVGAMPAGGPYELTVVTPSEKCVFTGVLIGERLLFSGQSNMEFTLGMLYDSAGGSTNGNAELAQRMELERQELKDAVRNASLSADTIRIFRTPVVGRQPIRQEFDGVAEWEIPSEESVYNTSATAWFFAYRLQRILRVPVGIVTAAVGGTQIAAWLSEETILSLQEDGVQVSTQNRDNLSESIASTQYRGLLPALQNMRFRAVVWYQGESDDNAADVYQSELEALISSWRELFHDEDLPFVIYSLARHSKQTYWNYDGFAEIRNIQRIVGMQPNNVFVNIMDTGHPYDIHPFGKKTVGYRGADLFLSVLYGRDLAYYGPSPKSILKDGNKVQITYETYGQPLSLHGNYGFDVSYEGSENFFINITDVRLTGENSVELTLPTEGTPYKLRFGGACGPGLTPEQEADVTCYNCLYGGDAVAQPFVYTFEQ